MRLVSQPNGNRKANVLCDLASTSVEPNWRVMTGAGSVTSGACNPTESVKVIRTKLSDSQQAIVIESFMQLEGAFARRYDYVSFPKESVNLDRSRRFVESKLLEFAGPYQDRYATSP